MSLYRHHHDPTFPAYLFVGDSYLVSASYGDYPASLGWSAYLYLSGSSASPAPITGSAAGDAFVFSLSDAYTSALPAGTYSWAIRCRAAASGTRTPEIGLTTVESTAPVATLISFYETMIRYCQLAMQNQLSDGEAFTAQSISGYSWTNVSLEELEGRHVDFQNKLAELRDAGTGHNHGGIQTVDLDIECY